MKQINISVSFDDEKLRALNKYLKKKELTAEDELAAALLHLYEKHVRPLCVSTSMRTM